MGADGLGCADNFLIGSGFVAVADIVHNGAGENKGVLHHNTHLGSEGAERHFGNIDAVN